MTNIQVFADIPRVQASLRPEKAATIFEGRQTTFAELDRRSNLVANGLLQERHARQSRVALLDKNSDRFFEVMFGSAKAGTALVSLNWRLAPVEVAYVLNDSVAETLFVGEEFVPLVESIRGEAKSVKKIVALSDSHPEWEPYTSWRDRQSAADPGLDLSPSDVTLQMYTSGTTGKPKGAQLTSNNLLVHLPEFVRHCGNWHEGDVNLVCMPLYHIGGSGYASVGIYAGATTIVAREANPATILELISKYGVTKAFFVPALILFMLNSPEIEEADLSSLGLIVYGASPAPVDLLRRAMSIFKSEFAQVYGLTETTGAVTWLPHTDHDLSGGKRLLSCGKPTPGVQIRIVDSLGRDVAVGDVGEVICCTDQNMKGYWNLPDATASTLRGGWLYTGDAGYMDEEGYLYIHDRIKDMIISGGENIYPAEIESALFDHPDIADAAAIGVPDEKWGEAVKVIVVRKPGSNVTADDIIAFARERLAHYKTPKSVDFVKALPRNPSGKLLKRELRIPYWKGLQRQVN